MINLYGSICLTDIPAELITTAQNGKKYLNIEVNEMKQPSQYGATHAVKASVRKADRKDGVNYFIGNLKPSKYGNGEATQPVPAPATMGVVAAMPQPTPGGFETSNNDLPF